MIVKAKTVSIFVVMGRPTMGGNGLRMGAGGAFEEHQPNICTKTQ